MSPLRKVARVIAHEAYKTKKEPLFIAEVAFVTENEVKQIFNLSFSFACFFVSIGIWQAKQAMMPQGLFGCVDSVFTLSIFY